MFASHASFRLHIEINQDVHRVQSSSNLLRCFIMIIVFSQLLKYCYFEEVVDNKAIKKL